MMAEETRKIYLKEQRIWVPVSEEVYHVYYQPIWRMLKREKKAGCCSCPKQLSFICNMDCLNCEYHTGSITLSLDATIRIDDKEIALGDMVADTNVCVPQIVEDRILNEQLKEETENLDEKNHLIIDMFCNGATEREIAEVIGVTHKAVNKRKNKIFKELRENLKDSE